MKNFIYLIVAVVLVSSCSNDDTNFSENLDLFLGTWQLKSITFQGDLILTTPSAVTIEFEKNSQEVTFNGSSTCNNYGGDVTNLTETNISFLHLFNTEIACSGDKGNFEITYFNLFSKIDRYNFKNNILKLYFEDNSYVSFEREVI